MLTLVRSPRFAFLKDIRRGLQVHIAVSERRGAKRLRVPAVRPVRAADHILQRLHIVLIQRLRVLALCSSGGGFSSNGSFPSAETARSGRRRIVRQRTLGSQMALGGLRSLSDLGSLRSLSSLRPLAWLRAMSSLRFASLISLGSLRILSALGGERALVS